MRDLSQVDSFGLPQLLTPTVLIATLAWMQAALWTNHRFSITRVGSIAVAMVLPVSAACVGEAIGGSESVVLVGVFLLISFGFGCAVYSLGRARCGAALEWPYSIKVATSKAEPSASRRDLVPQSPMKAQVWYEWKRYLMPLVCFILAWTCFLLGLSFYWPYSRFPRDGMLVAPVLFSATAALGIGGLNHSVGNRRVSPFFAAQPLSSFQFVMAKWLAAALSTAIVGGTGLAAYALAAVWSGQLPSWFAERWGVCLELHSLNKSIVGLSFVVGVYFLVTWVFLVQALPVKLSGRYWLETLVLWVLVGVLGVLLLDLLGNERRRFLLPLTLGGLLIGKGAAATFVLPRLLRRRVVTPSVLAFFLTCWMLVVGTCSAMLVWFGLIQGLAPTVIAIVTLTLFWPVTRIASAPLALDWNRHR